MAVHYPKALWRRCVEAGLRPVTIDCGAGIRFQGGVPPAIHFALIGYAQGLLQHFGEYSVDGENLEQVDGPHIPPAPAAPRPDQPPLPFPDLPPIEAAEPPPTQTPPAVPPLPPPSANGTATPAKRPAKPKSPKGRKVKSRGRH